MRDFKSVNEAQDLEKLDYEKLLSQKTEILTGLLDCDVQLALMDEVARKFAGVDKHSETKDSVENKKIENLRELLAYYTANYNCGLAGG